MKVVILAGGYGTRLAEETVIKPKPMVEVGGHPILWHIMKHYAFYDFNEFVIALGYKGDLIKRYFLDYHALTRDVTIRTVNGAVTSHGREPEDWTVHLIDTGLDTQTGGRVKRMRQWLGDETFMITYGDGVSNINLHDLVAFHHAHGKLATITAVRPPARFGEIIMNGEAVSQFTEKPLAGEGWVNGGFMVYEPEVLDYIDGDHTDLSKHVLNQLAADGQLMAYQHVDFWQCMDTLRDVRLLDRLWKGTHAPWKVWE